MTILQLLNLANGQLLVQVILVINIGVEKLAVI